jgi:hypothetical protein
MRYRTLDVRLWGDVKFRALSPLQPSGQALFLYLLTNPNTTSIPGLYRAGAAGMAEELGWTTKGFLEVLQEVLDQGLIKVDLNSRVVFIPNVARYNKPQSPNVIKSWTSHWDEIPECELKNIAYQSLKLYVDGLGEAYIDAFDKTIGKPKYKAMPNQEQEQEKEQEINISSLREDVDRKSDDTLKEKNTISANCPHNEIIGIYHEVLPMCPPVRMWNKTRRGYLKQRWSENPEHQNLEWWRNFFTYVKQSQFLIGKISGRDGKPPFLANLEWLVKPSNFAKVIEGNYHGEVI